MDCYWLTFFHKRLKKDYLSPHRLAWTVISSSGKSLVHIGQITYNFKKGVHVRHSGKKIITDTKFIVVTMVFSNVLGLPCICFSQCITPIPAESKNSNCDTILFNQNCSFWFHQNCLTSSSVSSGENFPLHVLMCTASICRGITSLHW